MERIVTLNGKWREPMVELEQVKFEEQLGAAHGPSPMLD